MEILMALGKDDITEKMAEGSEIIQIGLAYKIKELVLCVKCGLETSRIPGLKYSPSPPLALTQSVQHYDYFWTPQIIGTERPPVGNAPPIVWRGKFIEPIIV